jgi:hypothetical protein
MYVAAAGEAAAAHGVRPPQQQEGGGGGGGERESKIRVITPASGGSLRSEEAPHQHVMAHGQGIIILIIIMEH